RGAGRSTPDPPFQLTQLVRCTTATHGRFSRLGLPFTFAKFHRSTVPSGAKIRLLVTLSATATFLSRSKPTRMLPFFAPLLPSHRVMSLIPCEQTATSEPSGANATLFVLEPTSAVKTALPDSPSEADATRRDRPAAGFRDSPNSTAGADAS